MIQAGRGEGEAPLPYASEQPLPWISKKNREFLINLSLREVPRSFPGASVLLDNS